MCICHSLVHFYDESFWLVWYRQLMYRLKQHSININIEVLYDFQRRANGFKSRRISAIVNLAESFLVLSALLILVGVVELNSGEQPETATSAAAAEHKQRTYHADLE